MPFENALLVWRTVEGQVFPLSEREPAKWIEFVTRQREPLLRPTGSPLWWSGTRSNTAGGSNGDCHLPVQLLIRWGQYPTFRGLNQVGPGVDAGEQVGVVVPTHSGTTGAVAAAVNYGSQFAWNVSLELSGAKNSGPLNRVADNSLAKNLLGWEPKTMFMDGLHKTIDRYVANKKRAQVSEKLEAVLTER